ncbi:MAG: metallophosphatase family protein [Gemmatimonadota bacterium]|nr:metallophosphatase family protein [Gemmatimonadota bacterium]
MSPPSTRRIGLISDTHGLVRASVHPALAGVEMILHAGDVGGDEILDELRLIAPVHAVAGNTDIPGEYEPEFAVTVGGVRIHVSHGHEVGAPAPARLAARYDADVIVYGHTHQQLVTRIGDRIVVNPGAAGPRRFRLQPSVAVLTIENGKPEVEIIELD